MPPSAGRHSSVGLRWSVTVDAYGEASGPVEQDARTAPPIPANAGCLAFHGIGDTPEAALDDARRQWLDQLPWVLGILDKLERAERAGSDLEDGELVHQLRHLVGGDPVPEGRASIPSFALPGWVALVRRVMAVHARDVLDDAERSEGGPRDVEGTAGVALSMANVQRTSGGALRTFAERSREAVALVERSGRISFANRAAGRLLGRRHGELPGHDLLDLFPAEHAEALRGALEGSLAAPGRLTAVEVDRTAEGGSRPPLALGFAHHVVSAARDVVVVRIAEAGEEARAARQERELEAQLWQAQKMVAVGQMTAGIAHDFNNILAVILANVELLELTLDEGADDVREELDALRDASQRGAQMIRKLMGFSRSSRIEVGAVDLVDAFAEMERMLRSVLPVHVLELAIEPGTRALCDVNALQQMVLNLVTNARDAMIDGGKVVVRAAPDRVREGDGRPTWMTPGRYARIDVVDTGVGMDAATRARILEPFFTTKGAGAGTGLGLAMVYGLAKQQQGFIDFRSEPARGTTAMLYLPQDA